MSINKIIIVFLGYFVVSIVTQFHAHHSEPILAPDLGLDSAARVGLKSYEHKGECREDVSFPKRTLTFRQALDFWNHDLAQIGKPMLGQVSNLDAAVGTQNVLILYDRDDPRYNFVHAIAPNIEQTVIETKSNLLNFAICGCSDPAKSEAPWFLQPDSQECHYDSFYESQTQNKGQKFVVRLKHMKEMIQEPNSYVVIHGRWILGRKKKAKLYVNLGNEGTVATEREMNFHINLQKDKIVYTTRKNGQWQANRVRNIQNLGGKNFWLALRIQEAGIDVCFVNENWNLNHFTFLWSDLPRPSIPLEGVDRLVVKTDQDAKYMIHSAVNVRPSVLNLTVNERTRYCFQSERLQVLGQVGDQNGKNEVHWHSRCEMKAQVAFQVPVKPVCQFGDLLRGKNITNEQSVGWGINAPGTLNVKCLEGNAIDAKTITEQGLKCYCDGIRPEEIKPCLWVHRCEV